jgi:hypothetical protein
MLSGNDRPGSKVVDGARPRRFRRRIIPACFLWLISAFAALVSLGYLTFVIWNNIELRWNHPDPDLLEITNENLLSPPVVATAFCGPFIAFVAALAALSCIRGQWCSMIRYAMILAVLWLFAAYLSPPE